jgi:K+-sensing histidine kinase KdpD
VFAFASRYANDAVRVRLSKQNQHCAIKIFACGPQLSSADFNRLFDLYSEAQSRYAFDNLNQRLTLRIASYIIEAHQGSFIMESNGADTTFVINLPCLNVDDDDER